MIHVEANPTERTHRRIWGAKIGRESNSDASAPKIEPTQENIGWMKIPSIPNKATTPRAQRTGQVFAPVSS